MNLSHTDVFAMNHPPFDTDEMGLCRMPIDASFRRIYLRKTGEIRKLPVLEECKPEEASHLAVAIQARIRLTSSPSFVSVGWEVIFRNLLFPSDTPSSTPSWRPEIIRELDFDESV